MKTIYLVVLGVLIGLLAAGLITWIALPPQGEPVRLLPPPTPEPLKVYVDGAVTYPGVYDLDPASRVEDALLAAGGALPDARMETVNLAAKLADGQKVHIPDLDEQILPTAAVEAIQGEKDAFTGLININTAGIQELQMLEGIGPTRAEDILAYRESHGPFQKIEDLMEVTGIGEVTFDRIRDQITLDP